MNERNSGSGRLQAAVGGRKAGAVLPNIVNPLFYMLVVISVLGTFLIEARASLVEGFNYHFLVWNLFLAWLPLLVSMTALLLPKWLNGFALGAALTAWGVGWLLLFPNAPYLTTDYIHLIFSPTHIGYERYGLLVWYDLVLFFLFSWCGLMLGYLSMRNFHAIVEAYAHKAAGWAFVLVSSLLGGFGVYLGRVIRLNSWDAVFNVSSMIDGVFRAVNARAFVFTLLFGTLILVVYLSLYLVGLRKTASA